MFVVFCDDFLLIWCMFILCKLFCSLLIWLFVLFNDDWLMLMFMCDGIFCINLFVCWMVWFRFFIWDVIRLNVGLRFLIVCAVVCKEELFRIIFMFLNFCCFLCILDICVCIWEKWLVVLFVCLISLLIWWFVCLRGEVLMFNFILICVFCKVFVNV